MLVVPGLFSLLVAAAGWYYLFYSRAALNLAGVEQVARNRLRTRLRRIGGSVMIGLGITFFVAFDALERRRVALFVSLMLIVFILLMTILVLGIFDLRLTRRFRRDQEKFKR